MSLTGNVVSGVLRKPAAVQVLDSRRILINGNSILDSDGSGLVLRDVSDSLVSGNIVRDDRAAEVRSRSVSIEVNGGSGNFVGGNLTREK